MAISPLTSPSIVLIHILSPVTAAYYHLSSFMFNICRHRIIASSHRCRGTQLPTPVYSLVVVRGRSSFINVVSHFASFIVVLTFVVASCNNRFIPLVSLASVISSGDIGVGSVAAVCCHWLPPACRCCGWLQVARVCCRCIIPALVLSFVIAFAHLPIG